MTMDSQPILNSYWVTTGKLLAGEYPGATDDDRARGRLRWLLKQGVTAWLDLTEEGEPGLLPYAKMLEDEATLIGKHIRHIRMAIADFSTPPQEYMVRILNTLDELLDESQTVYLHCYGGRGRTGTVVGCYLVHLGLDGEEALARIASWRKGTPKGDQPSPETPEQCLFVLNWKD